MKKRIKFILLFLLIFFIIGFIIFSPLYKSNSVYINYGLVPYDICQKQPELWKTIKLIFIISIITCKEMLSISQPWGE